MKKHILFKGALFLIIGLVCMPMTMQAKVEHLLPLPQKITTTQDAPFALGGNVSINYDGGAEQCALLEEFFTTNGCAIAEGGKVINVTFVEAIEGAHDYELHGYENEAYTLSITTDEINITAVTGTGVIRAAQTLTQLAEGWDGTPALETITIKDWPAFKLRGYMHDVGRSFISTDELVKQIELFSRFKVNTFHWHLTENQAWRFEVKAYPELTSDASMTRFPGQYYTQEDCKRVMKVAQKHGVIVIPEIDMPGHSEAFERAMHFGMQTEEGKVVLKKVIDEAVEVFAGAPYIHIGGDEVSTTADYLNEMIAYAESKGANVKGGLWNPINGIGQDALNNTLAQMWGTRGWLATGKANIDCRYNYTNHFDVFADLVGIYKSTVYYSQQGSSEVAGAISGCWNDRKVATEKDIMAQNNVWANVIATAERAWMGGGKQYIDNATNTPDKYKANPYGGGVMLPNSGEEYEEFKGWETRFLFHKANSLKDEPIPYVKQTNVRWRITDAFPNDGNKTAAFGPEAAGITASTDLLPEIYEHDGQTYYTGMATGAGIYLAHTWGNSIINAYYSNPQFNHTAYAWTYVYSPEEQEVGAQIEFQNYSRSEQDGAASAGNWDHFGSKIWINGKEIAAPAWENTGVSISSKEVMLKNENFPGRDPIKVTLKQGWNKVFLKLPYMNTGYRLKKWMFTCVFTDIEGVNAVEGLIYSPNQCMDEATELVAAEISNIKRNRGNYIGTAVGLWPESAAAALDAKVKEVEDSYSTTMTAEQRATQAAELQTAWTTFVSSLKADEINLPVSGNYYRMYTPARDNRYPTGKGAGNAVMGEQNPSTKASIWQFVTRTDGSYNIINMVDGTYISPASNNNTALNCVAEQPNAGWTIKSAGVGKVIITSGSAQFNQTNSGQGYKLYNWGSGTNTTDTGCLYEMIDVTAIAPATPIKLITNYEEFENGGVYNFVTERGWMGATANSNNAISTARTAVTPAADNPYFQWTVYKSKNGNYYLYNLGKQKFLGVQNSNNASVSLVDNPAGKQLTFKNSSSSEYPIMFSTDNAGVVNHSSNYGEGLITWTGGWNTLDDAGSNHKVAWVCSLSDEALAKITDLVEAYDVFVESTPTAPQPIVKVYGLSGQTYPYAIDATLAAKVFVEGTITIAIDVTMPASLAGNTRYALVCAADPTQGVTGATKTNSPYVGYGLNGSNPVYLPSSANGDKFTYRDFSVSANTRYKIVYVVDRTNNELTIYVDGAQKSTATFPVQGYELQSFSNFASNANAKFYIGGGIVNNTTEYDKFSGTIHSVQFFNKVLSASEVTAIDYTESEQPEEEEDIIDTDVLESTPINNVEEFENGGVYTFVTKRGWMGAAKDNSKVISTACTTADPVAAANNKYFQWTVYKSARGNYYLYNMGKKKFMGVQSGNNIEIDFVEAPAGKKLTFKKSGSQEYPIMFSTDNAGVVNHSTVHGGGLINWTGGWDNLNDDGSNHKVTRVKRLGTDDLKSIADLIEAYDAFIYVTAEVEGLTETNPNTHFGCIKANSILTNLKKGTGVVVADYDGTKETITIEFSRAYRGFEFLGFRVGSQELGKSFQLTAELNTLITTSNPLVAKFVTTEDVTLWYDDDPFSYRIPAIGKTSTGRLIAVSDYRYSLDDIGRYNYGTATPGIDLVIRVSDDNGKTWGPTKTIAKCSSIRDANDCAYGDAAIAVVGQKVLVMGAAGDVMFGNGSATAHNRTVRIFSEDNGETWTAPQDISETLFIGENATIKNGYTAFFGSGKLAVDENYNNTGNARIYGAMLIKKEGYGNAIYVIYTDDFGMTWNILGGSQNPVTTNDEPKVEILPSGQILLSVRRNGGRQFNVFTYSDKATNAGSWGSNVNGCSNGGSNTCNGEIYCVDAMNANDEKVKLLLQSQPKGGSGLYDRRDVTFWYKEITEDNYTSNDIANNWEQGLQVSTQQSAYSTMVLQNDGKIAFFFEEAPCYGDDQAKGYCMVYIPVTIEDITNGNYNTPEFIEDNETTSIESPLSAIDDSKPIIYNLMGRKVEKTDKGIYIINGQKVVVE